MLKVLPPARASMKAAPAMRTGARESACHSMCSPVTFCLRLPPPSLGRLHRNAADRPPGTGSARTPHQIALSRTREASVARSVAPRPRIGSTECALAARYLANAAVSDTVLTCAGIAHPDCPRPGSAPHRAATWFSPWPRGPPNPPRSPTPPRHRPTAVTDHRRRTP